MQRSLWCQTRNRPIPLTCFFVDKMMARFRNFYSLWKFEKEQCVLNICKYLFKQKKYFGVRSTLIVFRHNREQEKNVVLFIFMIKTDIFALQKKLWLLVHWLDSVQLSSGNEWSLSTTKQWKQNHPLGVYIWINLWLRVNWNTMLPSKPSVKPTQRYLST